MLQELAEEELNIDLVRALRTLGNSLTGVRHILKGNIIMMEEAKAIPSLSSSVCARRTCPTVTCPCGHMGKVLTELCDRSLAVRLRNPTKEACQTAEQNHQTLSRQRLIFC